MFEINNLQFKQVVKYHQVFHMKNFYKKPEAISNLLKNMEPEVHKKNEIDSLNGKMFLDRRHSFYNDSLIETEKKLKNFFSIESESLGLVTTNVFKMLDEKFNNYKENYWWPHKDNAQYVCLIYLNDPGCDGTNLYEDTNFNPTKPEHQQPWINKKNFTCFFTFKPSFNDLFIFPANMLHGMNIETDRFFKEDRINQAIFL